jgi:hypothetical protein
MSYRMPFPDPFLPIVLIAAIVSGFSMWLFNAFSSISSKSRETHTRFAISQIVSHIDGLEEAEFPMSSGDLIKQLKEASIDWNSCRIDGGRILDGWGQSIDATFDHSTESWTFRSSGKDRNFGTDDDIQGSTPRNAKGEQGGTGQPATRPVFESECSDKPQPEAEGRSR